MKARVFAGQAKPRNGMDFAWLTKEELAEYLPSEYYNAVKNSLSEF